MKNKKGFMGIVIVILISIIAIGLVGIAWYYEKNKVDITIQLEPKITTVISNSSPISSNSIPIESSEKHALTPITKHDTNTVEETFDWQSVKYQRNDHGIEFQIPSDWTYTQSGPGLNDGDYIFSANDSSTDSSSGVRINLNTIYHANESNDTLAEWVKKYRDNKENYTFNEPIKLVGINDIYILSEAKSENEWIQLFGFIARDSRIYEFIFSGSIDAMTLKSGTINTILKSIDFINTLPVITVSNVNVTQAVETNIGYELEVNWLKAPEQLNMIDQVVRDSEKKGCVYERSFYKVGDITNGYYLGQELLIILERPCGPSFQPTIYRVVYNTDSKTYTYLEKHSANLSYIDFPFVYDIDSSIPDLGYPTEIDIPNSSVDLVAETFEVNKLFSLYPDAKSVFTDPIFGLVYFDSHSNCYFIVMPDGLVKIYNLKLDFLSDFNDKEYSFGSNSFIPNITWNEGVINSDSYTFNEPTGGCGTSTCHAMFTEEELGGLEALKVSGITSTGDKIYEFIDDNNEILVSTYDSFYVPYDEDRISYDEFTKSHPFFYWQDPFGHWVRFKQESFLPAVECGKPVIYLYPEETMNVNVQVEPNGGFTLTEPKYPSGGWDVIANPDGRLKYGDGNIYTYLFWEGLGMNYEIQKKGFVVSVDKVEEFLYQKLTLLGLNEQESFDFMEFWLPKMQEKPYYFITFVDQAVFDQLAPLTVKPEPDTVIRVFMDYKGLDKFEYVENLEIVTPERIGFTVVEWGGALH